MEVPFVASIPWDGGDFETFPSRNGFPQHPNGNIDMRNHSTEELCCLMQSWLYFGFLECLLGQRIDRDSFVKQSRASSDGLLRLVVDSTPLEQLLGRRLRISWRAFRWFFERRPKSLLSLFNRNREMLDHFEAHFGLYSGVNVSEIMFSCEILLETIMNLFYNRPEEVPSSIIHKSSNKSAGVGTRLLMQKMKVAGWCDAELSELSLSSTATKLFYVSQLSRPKIHGLTHDACTELQCSANNVDQLNYTNRHVEDGCSCGMISVPQDELIDILRSGKIPLVQIIALPHGKIQLRVQPAQASTRYTAISHVWSDGLGNPTSNSLYHCQLEMISKTLRSIPNKSKLGDYFTITQNDIFWMDTLCIPPAIEHKDLRMASINKMAAIYVGAAKVLVLDRGLQQIRIAACESNEILAHIVYCAWNRRCWTLQEGALGNPTIFLFADGVVDPSSYNAVTPFCMNEFPSQYRNTLHFNSLWSINVGLWETPKVYGINENISIELNDQLRVSCLEFLSTSWKVKGFGYYDPFDSSPVLNRTDAFVTIWNALRGRTTTKAEDLYAILSNLVDLDTSIISSEIEEERLWTIMCSLEYLPLALLFNTGPRIRPTKMHHNRWVPTVPGPIILQNDHVMKLESTCLSIWSDSLLQGNTCGLISIKPGCPTGTSLILQLKRHRQQPHQIKMFLHIEFLREKGKFDEIDLLDPDETIVLIEDIVEHGKMDISRGSWSGASFHASKSRWGTNRIAPQFSKKMVSHVIYDCPVLVTISSSPLKPMGLTSLVHERQALEENQGPVPGIHDLPIYTMAPWDYLRGHSIDMLLADWELKVKCGM